MYHLVQVEEWDDFPDETNITKKFLYDLKQFQFESTLPIGYHWRNVKRLLDCQQPYCCSPEDFVKSKV